MNSEQTSKNILTYINDGMSGFEKLFSRLNLSFGVNTVLLRKINKGSKT